MENSLFRKKSLEHITSPDELHDYMRVTGPRLWMVLGAVVILMAGFIAYASTATMENTMPIMIDVTTYENTAEAQAQGAQARYTIVSADLPLSSIDTVRLGMRVRVGKEQGTVKFITTYEDENGAVDVLIDMDQGYISLPDGRYEAELVLESTTPISFLWNN